jgi:hypothetical protein
MSHRDIIEDRAAVLLGSRDPRTGRYIVSALEDQIVTGLRELGMRIRGSMLSEDQFREFNGEVARIFQDAQDRLIDLAVDHAEATCAEGPGA